MLRILNSQTRTKEVFKPLDPEGRKVTMYTCGPTVYDSFHLGHARFAVVADVIRRYLEHRGYQVRFVMNITDVDDKIIKKAIKEGCDWRQITAVYIAEFHRVMHALNVMPADMYPRATDHIAEMIDIVQRLIEKKHAYVAGSGDVYFDIATCERYGELSGRKLDEEEAGLSGRLSEERLKVKRNPGDFVVWKLNRNDHEEIAAGGDQVPGWNAPWGFGRPGWHLECSAMSARYLGLPFDIHAGGQDLQFPHHEDEKAQSECAFALELAGKRSVNYWVHNGFVTVKARPEDGQVDADLVDAATGSVKMSKSLGNVKWVREMIRPEGPFDPMALRMMLLSSHYRSPIVFEPALLDEATARLDRIHNALEAVGRVTQGVEALGAEVDGELLHAVQKSHQAFKDAMDDDFNTAGALGAVFDLIGALNQRLAADPTPVLVAGLRCARTVVLGMLSVLGLRTERAQARGTGDTAALIDLLMQSRQDARKAREFALADRIRDGLAAAGYEIKDLPGGKWEVKQR